MILMKKNLPKQKMSSYVCIQKHVTKKKKQKQIRKPKIINLIKMYWSKVTTKIDKIKKMKNLLYIKKNTETHKSEEIL